MYSDFICHIYALYGSHLRGNHQHLETNVVPNLLNFIHVQKVAMKISSALCAFVELTITCYFGKNARYFFPLFYPSYIFIFIYKDHLHHITVI